VAARDRVRDRANNANSGGGVAVAERPSALPPVIRMLTDPKQKGEFAKALPAGSDVDRYLRTARTAVQANPTLLRCDPRSIIAAIHKAAAYGLDVGPIGQAYLVPYKDQAQLVIGYRGMLALARRSGELVSIEAREVKEHDDFEYEYGLNPKLRHVPAMVERGEVVCYYGLAHFRSGGFYMIVVDLDTIAAHRAESKTANSDKSPWQTHPEAMGRKTVIRIMEPYLPLTTEAAEAIIADDSPTPDDTYTYIEATHTPDEPYDEVGEIEPPPPAEPEVEPEAKAKPEPPAGK
jgi:recombination protein RecT